MANDLSAAVDGAPAMLGWYRGFLRYLKRQIPNLLTIHCVIHRQHLVANNLSSNLIRHCVAKRLLLEFPSSYLAEKAFSVVVHFIAKKRNRLVIVARRDLGLNWTEFEPDIEDLISKHVAHQSHSVVSSVFLIEICDGQSRNTRSITAP